jgi:hypothetical protein
MTFRRSSAVFLPLLALVGLSVSLVPGDAGAAAKSGTPLIGTFKLTAGLCSGYTVSGTYFRMIFPNGSIANGKFFTNPDSLCSNNTYTLAVPGTQGGFVTGKYQPNPAPAFSGQGSALADKIVTPQSFTAIDFSIATNKKDPQTGTTVPPPSIIDTNGKLSGQMEAWSASWNKQYFNQGSPKPNGSRPGLTRPVTGTYNAKTHAFVITWASEVVGGPFNSFTGYWHLSGTFIPAK